jgi:hypothetical protein
VRVSVVLRDKESDAITDRQARLNLAVRRGLDIQDPHGNFHETMVTLESGLMVHYHNSTA